MLDDLKNYREEEDAFALFTPSEAGALLGLLLFGLVVFDLLRQLFSWMTS